MEFARRSSHSSAAHSDRPSSFRILLNDKSSLFKFTRVSRPVMDMISFRDKDKSTSEIQASRQVILRSRKPSNFKFPTTSQSYSPLARIIIASEMLISTDKGISQKG
mmetsp:Transcript_24543/g.45743  ORF Transcript_24543/g.45743 Transcript_24543/m.45743 type:complete len:107 (+) Transcript_24543:784-1104(+)